MAWVVAFKAFCPVLGTDAYMLEDRQYQQDEGEYTVAARRCSYDITCNLDDHIRCEWNFKPGGTGEEPFELKEQ